MLFWSSVDLTGNQTGQALLDYKWKFWSSVDLTGNQTRGIAELDLFKFWSSVDLTGNQTGKSYASVEGSFGAVSI